MAVTNTVCKPLHELGCLSREGLLLRSEGFGEGWGEQRWRPDLTDLSAHGGSWGEGFHKAWIISKIHALCWSFLADQFIGLKREEIGEGTWGGRKPTTVISHCLWDTRKVTECLCHPEQRTGRGQNPSPFKAQQRRPKGSDSRSHPLCLYLKLNHTISETKSLHRNLTQAQDRKVQLEEEIMAYEERMKKLNMELKKLQGFHQESELEVKGSLGLRLSSCSRSPRSPLAPRTI